MVPILPVVTKADTMTTREAATYRREVYNKLQNPGVPGVRGMCNPGAGGPTWLDALPACCFTWQCLLGVGSWLHWCCIILHTVMAAGSVPKSMLCNVPVVLFTIHGWRRRAHDILCTTVWIPLSHDTFMINVNIMGMVSLSTVGQRQVPRQLSSYVCSPGWRCGAHQCIQVPGCNHGTSGVARVAAITQRATISGGSQQYH